MYKIGDILKQKDDGNKSKYDLGLRYIVTKITKNLVWIQVANGSIRDGIICKYRYSPEIMDEICEKVG
jgi:hypothetical protein